MIDKNLFKSIFNNISKISTSQEDNYRTSCLLGYYYFKKRFKMIPIDLRKQQLLDADRKAIQQINFRRNPARDPNTIITMFFIIEEAKESVLDFSQGTVRVL